MRLQRNISTKIAVIVCIALIVSSAFCMPKKIGTPSEETKPPVEEVRKIHEDPQAPAAAIYISPYGSDTKGDGTTLLPFATLTKAYRVLSTAAAQTINTILAYNGEYQGVPEVINMTLTIASVNDDPRKVVFLGSGKTISIQLKSGETQTKVKFQSVTLSATALRPKSSTVLELEKVVLQSSASEYGALHLLEDGSALVKNTTIKDSYYGIYQNDFASSVSMQDSEVQGCFYDGIFMLRGNLLIARSKVYANGRYGVSMGDQCSISASDSQIFSNQLSGITSSGGRFTGTNLKIYNNRALTNGAGIALSSNAKMNLFQSEISNNKAKSEGGAFSCKGRASFILRESTIKGNTADVAAKGQCHDNCVFFSDNNVYVNNTSGSGKEGSCDYSFARKF